MPKAPDDVMTVPKFVAAKKAGRKLVVLTAYDHPTARLFDELGVDALLVGDTLGMVVAGRPDTLSVTMDQMVYHTEMVARAARRSLIIGDMPFLSYQAEISEAIRNAGRLIKEGGAHAVKLEGGRRSAETVRAINAADIPVMGHIGLTPQSIHKFGHYHVQRDQEELVADAHALEEAGAFSIVLESMPSQLARTITESVSIPTIGIGAGPDCDGQVLVWQDALGMTAQFHPRFVKHFTDLHSAMTEGVLRYCQEVRDGSFPDKEHSYR